MKKTFTVTIMQEEDWFVAKCVENGVASQGENIEEAIGNLKEAIELFYEDEQIPEFSQTFVTTLEVAV